MRPRGSPGCALGQARAGSRSRHAAGALESDAWPTPSCSRTPRLLLEGGLCGLRSRLHGRDRSRLAALFPVLRLWQRCAWLARPYPDFGRTGECPCLPTVSAGFPDHSGRTWEPRRTLALCRGCRQCLGVTAASGDRCPSQMPCPPGVPCGRVPAPALPTHLPARLARQSSPGGRGPRGVGRSATPVPLWR